MRYALRKKGTDQYLDQDGGYGELEDAYTYSCKHLAEDDVNENEEVISILKLEYTERQMDALVSQLAISKNPVLLELLAEIAK